MCIAESNRLQWNHSLFWARNLGNILWKLQYGPLVLRSYWADSLHQFLAAMCNRVSPYCRAIWFWGVLWFLPSGDGFQAVRHLWKDWTLQKCWHCTKLWWSCWTNLEHKMLCVVPKTQTNHFSEQIEQCYLHDMIFFSESISTWEKEHICSLD